MATITNCRVETNLGFRLASQLSTSATSFVVNFFDRVTGEARDPNSTNRVNLLVVVDKGSESSPNPNYETMLFSSMSAGSTTGEWTITAVRGLTVTGNDWSSATGKIHQAGAEGGCVDVAQLFNSTSSVFDGTKSTGAATFRVGRGVSENITIYFDDGTGNLPFVRKDTSAGLIYSNDGVSSTPFGTGAGVTGGDGVTVTAGDIDIDLTDTTIFKDARTGAEKRAVATKAADGYIDSSFYDPTDFYQGVDRQTFSASGTWTKPTSFTPKKVTVICIGGGGGGGGGEGQAAGNVRMPGCGGGGGARNMAIYNAADLAATVAVTVGTGGTGGAGGNATSGTSGGVGGTTSFGAHLLAYGGGGGKAGTTLIESGAGGGGGGTASAGNTPTSTSNSIGGAPGAGTSSTPTSGTGGAGTSGSSGSPAEYGGGAGGGVSTGQNGSDGGGSMFGGAGGGGGSGVDGANSAASTTGSGGIGNSYSTGGGAAGGVGGVTGTAGTAGTAGTSLKGGGGGGGGGGSTGATGGAGGAGGSIGGGGGGGGGGTSIGGAGGAGGDGYVWVFTE